SHVKGSPFPMVSNLFGTLERARFLFRDSLDAVRKAVELKSDPGKVLKQPWRYWKLPGILWRMRPRFVRRGPILEHTCRVGELPQLQCWPLDGGPFITFAQVYTDDPDASGWMKLTPSMYCVTLSGHAYARNREVGLHYQ